MRCPAPFDYGKRARYKRLEGAALCGVLKLRAPAKVLVQMGSQLNRSAEPSTITERPVGSRQIEAELAAIEASVEGSIGVGTRC